MVSKTILVNILSRSDLYSVLESRASAIRMFKMEEYILWPCHAFERQRKHDCQGCPVSLDDRGSEAFCDIEVLYLRMLTAFLTQNATDFNSYRTQLLAKVQAMEAW